MARRACVVCETNRYAEEYCHLEGQDYLHCGNCGLIFVDRLLKAEELYKAYSGSFLKSLRRKLQAPVRRLKHYKNYEQSWQRAVQIVRFSIAQAPTTGEKGKYLDIGCNRGFNLAVADEFGWDVYGIELVPELMRPFINTYPKYRNQIFSERFEDAKRNLQHDMFDVITGIDIVEHFEDVTKDLSGIYEILKPGGAVVIQTPDAGCERARMEKCEWGALKPLEHLHLFNGKNLEALASRVGFTDYGLEKEFEEADGNFVAVLRK